MGHSDAVEQPGRNAKDLFVSFLWRAEQRNIAFEVDEYNQAAVKAMCYYFAGDRRFERAGDGFSLNKGLMLCGGAGVGKTTLMEVCRVNPRRCYTIVSCRKIVDTYATEGHGVLHHYSNPVHIPASRDSFYQREIGVCFDDLGTEGSRRHYGDQVNVMADILLNRYDGGTTPFCYTHITTNHTADEIEQFYGTRVRSRMREMFNMITLKGGDRRK